jgi:hypothetical protein
MNFRLKFLCALKHENRNILCFASLPASLFLASAGEKILLNETFPGCGICETDDGTIEEFLKANIYHSRRQNGRNPRDKQEENSH